MDTPWAAAGVTADSENTWKTQLHSSSGISLGSMAGVRVAVFPLGKNQSQDEERAPGLDGAEQPHCHHP